MPSEEALQKARAALRRPAGPGMPFPATLAGPGQSVESAVTEAPIKPLVQTPEQRSELQTAAETLGAVATAPLGGPIAAGLRGAARGVGVMESAADAAAALTASTRTRIGNYLTGVLGRSIAASGGTVLGGDLASPGDESEEEADWRRSLSIVSTLGGEAVMPLAHEMTNPLMRSLRKFQRKSLEPEMLLRPGALEAQKALLAEGETLLPAQVRENGAAAWLEGVVSGSFGGAGPLREGRHRAMAGSQRALDRVVGMLPELSREEAGTLLNTAINNAAKLHRALTRAAYGDVDIAVEQANLGKVIDLRPVYDRFNTEFEAGLAAGDPEALRIKAMFEKFQAAPDPNNPGAVADPRMLVTFKQAAGIRSRLNAIARTGNAIMPEASTRLGPIAGLVDDEMKAGAARAGRPDIIELEAAARKLSRKGHETFDEAIIGNLVGKVTPEATAQSLFSADATRINKVREILYNQRYASALGGRTADEIWGDIQGAKIADLRRLAGEATTDLAEQSKSFGKKLGAALDTKGDQIAAIFPNEEQRKAMRTAARAFELGAGAPTGQPGHFLIQMAQGSALGAAAGLGSAFLLGADPRTIGVAGGAGAAAGAAAILLAPVALAQLLVRPSFVNFLMRRALSRSVVAGRAGADFVAQAVSHIAAERIPFGIQHPDGTVEQFGPESFPPPGQPQNTGLKPTTKLPWASR